MSRRGARVTGEESKMNSGQRIPHIGLLASAVLTAVSTIAFTVPATTQAATLLGAACGFVPAPHLSGETGHTAANGVNLRSGTSTNCQPPVTTINPSDVLSYQCWTEEQDGT